jgi:hypothetical protein
MMDFSPSTKKTGGHLRAAKGAGRPQPGGRGNVCKILRKVLRKTSPFHYTLFAFHF